jgi:hypothetical protein
MGGCNCKSGKEQKINNLNSIDHLMVGKDVVDRIISVKPFEEITDLDWVEIFQAHSQLYPNAKGVTGKEDAISGIQHAMGNLKLKYNIK